MFLETRHAGKHIDLSDECGVISFVIEVVLVQRIYQIEIGDKLRGRADETGGFMRRHCTQ